PVASLPSFESLRLEPQPVSPPDESVAPEAPLAADPVDALTSGELALLRARAPEPLPRDPDPVLNGLAEMIVRS
ncbi:MAG TPA: hypothetical protein DCR14_18825, partial [Acidimicrobiaceae bacterium]|nr:hypothetical protein [Acidimicrobiaceae bacterium]